jgi:hypothetical protein
LFLDTAIYLGDCKDSSDNMTKMTDWQNFNKTEMSKILSYVPFEDLHYAQRHGLLEIRESPVNRDAELRITEPAAKFLKMLRMAKATRASVNARLLRKGPEK